ncbi:MAG: tRNA pseudouridine(13) synthase TruD [Planctomycetaceae bacterium]
MTMLADDHLPYLTTDLPGLGGRIKVEPEDFVVEEQPLYRPSGSGEHLYLWIEKRDVSGERLLEHVARTLGISRNDIGMAGIKDRRAVTRQFLSVPNKAKERVSELTTESIRVLEVMPHGNKLRTGHLAGNHFTIRIRDPLPAATSAVPQLVERLHQLGFPNYYGEQRFGHDGETLDLGCRLLTGETTERQIPYSRRKFLLRLALSAVQSQLFNAVLAERLRSGQLHQVQPGDVLQVVASGGCFVAEDVAAEQLRFDRRETVLTGPMFGPKMKAPSGTAAELEQRQLIASGLSLDHFRRFPKLLPGTRRPLLVWPADLQAESLQDGVRLRFALPSGAYATTLLREVMKGDVSGAVQSADIDHSTLAADTT